MAHARAAAAAPATGDFRRPRRSSRTSGAVGLTPKTRDFRRETPSIRLCPCVDKTTHAQADRIFPITFDDFHIFGGEILVFYTNSFVRSFASSIRMMGSSLVISHNGT